MRSEREIREQLKYFEQNLQDLVKELDKNKKLKKIYDYDNGYVDWLQEEIRVLSAIKRTLEWVLEEGGGLW